MLYIYNIHAICEYKRKRDCPVNAEYYPTAVSVFMCKYLSDKIKDS